MATRPRLRWLQWGLLGLGFLLLGPWAWTYFESRGFQSAASKRLDAALRQAEAGSSPTAPSNPEFVGASTSAPPARAPELKGMLGRIEMPRLHLSAIVAEGSDLKTLKHAVGHISSTALPGDPGNCGLAGHRDTFLGALKGVRVDDVIHFVTPARTYTYQVEWFVVVEPHRVDVLDSTATRSLTLITCYPFGFVGHAPQRFVVRARQVEGVTRATAVEDRGLVVKSKPVAHAGI